MRGGSKKRKKINPIPSLMPQLSTFTAINIDEDQEEKEENSLSLIEKAHICGVLQPVVHILVFQRTHGISYQTLE